MTTPSKQEEKIIFLHVKVTQFHPSLIQGNVSLDLLFISIIRYLLYLFLCPQEASYGDGG